jgi:hypothetical protein
VEPSGRIHYCNRCAKWKFWQISGKNYQSAKRLARDSVKFSDRNDGQALMAPNLLPRVGRTDGTA